MSRNATLVVLLACLCGTGLAAPLFSRSDFDFESAKRSSLSFPGGLREPRNILRRSKNLEGAEKYLVADFNGDGTADLLSFEDKFAVRLTDSNASFSEPVLSGDCYGDDCSDYIWGTFAEDFDGDGLVDILHFGRNLDVWLSKGNGKFTEHHKPSVDACYGNPCWQLPPVKMDDFDGDGKVDLLKLAYNLDVWLAKGDGTFKPFIWTKDVCYGKPCWELPRVFTGDFNGDGAADFLNVGYNLDTWLSNGDGTFGEQNPTPGGCYGQSCERMWKVFVGDFNGDGKTDVLNLGEGLDVWLSDGKGTFKDMIWTSKICRFPCYAMRQAAIGDFNGDGSSDVMNVDRTLEVFLSKGDGTFQKRVQTSCGDDCKFCSCVHSIKVADFNGDSYSDVMAFSADGEIVIVWLSEGNGEFSEDKIMVEGELSSDGN